jgi:hypothetical protein
MTAQFVPDSPVEEGGFELAVPPRTERRPWGNPARLSSRSRT